MGTSESVASPREQTRVRLLGIIREAGATTRAELVKATGFSRSTIGHSVNQLLDSGLIEEAELADKGPGSGRGRPGLVLRPVPSTSHVAAIDFGHRHVTVAIADSLANIVATRRLEVGLDASDKIDRAAVELDLLRQEMSVEDISLITAGVPKPLNRTTGRVLAVKVGDGWGEMAPSHEIERRTGIAAQAENDAVLGAVGEHARGAARGLSDFLYVKVSHGIGSSLFLNGSPYRGTTGIVGNIGHCRLAGHAELCRCGNRGCLEAICSMSAIEMHLAATHPNAPASEVLEQMDETVARVLNGAGRALGRVLTDFCKLLAPEAIILGGSLGSGYPAFVEGVAWSVAEFGSPSAMPPTRVIPALLGSEAEIVGGVTLSAQSMVRGGTTSASAG